MSVSVVNLALFADTLVLLITGGLLLATARAGDWWLYELHRGAGAALLVLFIPKGRIVFRSLRRRLKRGTWYRLTTVVALGLLALLSLSLLFALGWTMNLLPFWLELGLYITPLAGHWYLALALVPLFLWHARSRWVPLTHIVPRSAFNPATAGGRITRRNAGRLLVVGLGGTLGLAALEAYAGVAGWKRRFTGSRQLTSFSGNDFPITQSDPIPAIDAGAWRLTVAGQVRKRLELSYHELLELADETRVATVDCTLGWASEQKWRGVRLTKLLERAGADLKRPVTVGAASGAFVILSATEADDALIATHVGDEPLNAAHGFPARLVVPTRRGYQWIKWIVRLDV